MFSALLLNLVLKIDFRQFLQELLVVNLKRVNWPTERLFTFYYLLFGQSCRKKPTAEATLGKNLYHLYFLKQPNLWTMLSVKATVQAKENCRDRSSTEFSLKMAELSIKPSSSGSPLSIKGIICVHNTYTAMMGGSNVNTGW
jgi:hypothetical protein